ncbi:cilia- and flagella-associated protein 54 [Pyxicephalus adspersus]|uniref:cilia- and flagella-associated protein 54 n=1 Tax=Pyxicephalus adspersus TaxID=30357 RepID=UPI003B5B753E
MKILLHKYARRYYYIKNANALLTCRYPNAYLSLNSEESAQKSAAIQVQDQMMKRKDGSEDWPFQDNVRSDRGKDQGHRGTFGIKVSRSSSLFHIWVKYKPRLPAWYYQEKLLKVGDSLVQIREYKLALFQCYGRYLEQFCSADIDEITDVEKFKSTFFPSGTDDKNASLTFHALQGRCICMYQLVKTSDANLQNQESVKKCLSILSFLQLIMQVVLPQEHLCWLIFNGTLHIYTICRHLMVLGHSSKALEFLLWASVCMESSVPLLSLHYLKWRATLYTAVCQCYFDCRAGVHGEVFARRAVSKISELSQLERMSDSSHNEEAKKAFKESTLKMAVMIFKRAVFESRRKPKEILRPKLKNNLKDVEKLPWPRTNTERLLVEMFSNNAAQFLAIVEALTDSNRRVIQAGPPVPDEPEIHDVIAELFFAGVDILSGGGIKPERGTPANIPSELSRILNDCSLLELAVEDKNAVSAEAVVKFSKLAFSYEHWEVFDAIVPPLYTFLQAHEGKKWKNEEMVLRILLAAEPLLSGKKHTHGLQPQDDHKWRADIPNYLNIFGLPADEYVENKSPDDYVRLAETLFCCACNPLQDVQPEKDIVIDVILYLWQKCKTGVHKMHTGTVDGSKFAQKCEINRKWIYILCLVYEVMQLSSIVDTDAVILGEAALRLAGIAESLADSSRKSGRKSDRSHEKINMDIKNPRNRPGFMKKTPVLQLIFAYETLDKAIKGLSMSRSKDSITNEGSVVDHYVTKLGVKRQHENNTAEEQRSFSKSLAHNVTMMDLQLELIVAQHRVSIKILNHLQESELLDNINKNNLSKAIFLMQKAVLFTKGLDNSPNKLLEDSEKLIQQTEAEENAVFLSCVKQLESITRKKNIPPPPILIHRTENSMMLKPAPFKSDIKVAWYCLFGRCVSGPNLKVRLNDHHLPGTGVEVPANGNNLLEARGLQKNDRYIFAVAAYSEDGRLIGDSVGETTKPILAFPPLSIPSTWAYLSQSAYHVGNYKVARKACSVLWNYFVLPPASKDLAVLENRKGYVHQMRLCNDAISKSSTILLQLFLGSIFTVSEINIKEGALFCDSLCDGGVLRKGQLCRIAECKRLLVALDVSTLLSDANYALQAVVQCYGLIAPVIYHRIPSVPVVQILIKCLAVFQEIPSSTWQKKTAGVTEGVLHMTACIVYYVAKMSVQKKNQKKRLNIAEKVNEQLSALEQHLLKLTKPVTGTELTGQEDPILLYSVVTCWSPNAAFKEVMKFRKKSRFLEFFVQLLQRLLSEEKHQKVLEWTAAVLDYLKRISCLHSFRRYTTVLVEYQKEQVSSTVKQTKTQNVTKRSENVKAQPKKKTQSLHHHKLSGEELEKKAFRTLAELLTPIVGRYIKRKRLIQASIEEMPWRAQMNLILALTHFSLFKKKLSQLCREELVCTQSINSYRLLDPELFTLHHAGTVVMATETKAADEQVSSPGHLHPSLKLDLPPDAKLTDSVDYSEPSTKRSDMDMDTPRTQMTNDTEMSVPSIKEQAKLNKSSIILLEHLGKVFYHLKKAMVLAHRGGHWTLLQNVCRVLWNLVLELQVTAKEFDATVGFFPITRDLLNREIWEPLYYAADLVLDMVVVLQNTGSLKVVEENENFSVPSCMGSIANEEGGSNLSFEYPFDDVTVIDMRWTCDLVLKSLEVLYHMKKWETLAHIAIQFNILTHERFTEQVTPLLVHAQRMVTGMNSQLKEPHDSAIHIQLGNSDDKMHCRNYIGKQLHVGTACNKVRNPGADIDRKGHIVHSDGRQRKTPTCVPLDVMDTFACFRDSLQKSKYSSRALKHSRKLLMLFLAYSQDFNIQERFSSMHTFCGKVGFSAGAFQAHQPLPPDLSEEEFLSACSIENKPIPSSQLSVVIASYDKTIEILHSDRQQSLKAQALHELGNLYMYAGNKRAAFKCWCQALDETLNMSDALNSWQELDGSPDSISSERSKDYSERFLSQAGIWGCLLAAVIASKMSRYILTSNVRQRTECCLFSALLFKSLFYVSLPHPDEDLDYALYEIGEGCDIAELIPGIDMFSDRHRADVNTVVSSLGFLISELHSAAQNIMVLPLLTLYQYFAATVCRDPVKYIEGKLIKIKVLTDLHLFAEAFHELLLLICGKRIPRRPHEGFCPGKPLASLKFSQSKTLLYNENLQAIEEIINRKPSACLLSSCDQITVKKVLLAKTHFMIKLASTINAIPEVVKQSDGFVTEESTNHQDTTDSKDEDGAPVKLTSKQDLTLSMIKGVLLNEAERRVTSIIQDIEMKFQSLFSECSSVDLEITIQSKLQLCEIAQQRQYTAVSVAMALSAMKILQEAKIFTGNTQSETAPPTLDWSTSRNTQANKKADIQPSVLEARERLNMHTWLQCRLALATTLVKHIRGIAINDQDMLDGSALITEGIVESETLNDYEIQAQFMLQAAFLDIQERHPKQGVQLLLQNIIQLLQGKPFISPMAQLTLAQSLILSADLMENNEDQQLVWSKQLNIFTSVHKLINKHLSCFGETTEHIIPNSSVPHFKNIYLPHMSLLAKIKMRIAQVLTFQVCSTQESSINLSELLPSLNLYKTALQVCREASFREYDLEAELLFLKGQTEHLMFLLGDHGNSTAIKSFSEAINVSSNYDHNFSVIRKAYLEIALLYIHMSNLDTNKDTITLRSTQTPETPKSKGKTAKVLVKENSEKEISRLEFYRLLAWIAVRSATQVGEAMLAYKQLIGESYVAVQTIDPKFHQDIPTFACIDLLANYKEDLPGCQDYTKKQKEIAGSHETEQLNLSIGEMSWVHIVRYQNHLMRLKNILTLTGFSDNNDRKMSASNTLYTSVFGNWITVRYAGMHLFLKKYLYSYSTCCVIDFPAELLWGLEHKSTVFHIPPKITDCVESSSSISSDSKTESEHITTNASDKELCMQWYSPPLERPGHMNMNPMVLLMYAYNKQSINIRDLRKCEPTELRCGCIRIPLLQVLLLQEKLSNLRQKAELSLHSVAEVSGNQQKRSTHTARERPDIKPVKVTQELQEMILECCSEAQCLLSSTADPQSVTKAPFDITLPSLIRLERVFDLTHGCMLMKGSLLDWVVSQFT